MLQNAASLQAMIGMTTYSFATPHGAKIVIPPDYSKHQIESFQKIAQEATNHAKPQQRFSDG